MSAEKVIILSTHILDEVDAVCTRAMIIAKGQVVADDTPAGLRAMSKIHGAVSLTLNNSDPEKLLSCIQDVNGVKEAKILEQDAEQFKVRVFPDSPDIVIADQLMSVLSSNNYDVKSVFVEQGRLDEVFRTITSS